MRRNKYLDSRTAFAAKVAEKAAKDAVDLSMHLAVIALNNSLGIGAERAERFLKEFERVAEEYDRECAEDYDRAREHLRRRLEQVLRCTVVRTD